MPFAVGDIVQSKVTGTSGKVIKVVSRFVGDVKYMVEYSAISAVLVKGDEISLAQKPVRTKADVLGEVDESTANDIHHIVADRLSIIEWNAASTGDGTNTSEMYGRLVKLLTALDTVTQGD